MPNDFLDQLPPPPPYPCDLVPRQADPNMKRATGKPQFSLIPLAALLPIARVFMFGNAKGYERNNWQEARDLTIYEDALGRHWSSWQSGESLDPESGLPHLAAMGANILILIWHHLVKGKTPSIEPKKIPYKLPVPPHPSPEG